MASAVASTSGEDFVGGGEMEVGSASTEETREVGSG